MLSSRRVSFRTLLADFGLFRSCRYEIFVPFGHISYHGNDNWTDSQRRLTFTAQIVIKKGGAIVHRESQSFDRRQAADAWIVKREDELKRPGGLERKENPPLSAVIDRYIAESKNLVLGTKAQVLKTIRNSDLGELKCSDITSQKLVYSPRNSPRMSNHRRAGTTFRIYRISSQLRGPLGVTRCPARNLMTPSLS